MLKVRVVTTANAVQVIRYVKSKTSCSKAYRTGHSQQEVELLLATAEEWIANYTHQISVFPESIENRILRVDDCEYHGFYYTFVYEVLNSLQERIGYTQLDAPC